MYTAVCCFYSTIVILDIRTGNQNCQVLQTAVWMMGRGDTWGGAARVAPPIPNSIGLYGKSYWCRPELVHSFIFDLAILQKYNVLTLELYAYLNYNLFSNNGNFSQMKSLFTNKLLMTAPPGFFLHISLRIGRPRISTKLGFYTQIMIICCILERDKHEHKWRILHFKAQPFVLLFKEMS